MKRWFGLVCVLGLGVLWYRDLGRDDRPSLVQVLNTAAPAQRIPVTIVLKQQADNAALERACVGLTKEQRWAYVVGGLKRLSNVTQRDLLSSLASQEASGQVSGVNPLWIVNEVYCEATPSAVQSLAARPEVWYVDYHLIPASLEAEAGGRLATGRVRQRSGSEHGSGAQEASRGDDGGAERAPGGGGLGVEPVGLHRGRGDRGAH